MSRLLILHSFCGCARVAFPWTLDWFAAPAAGIVSVVSVTVLFHCLMVQAVTGHAGFGPLLLHKPATFNRLALTETLTPCHPCFCPALDN